MVDVPANFVGHFVEPNSSILIQHFRFDKALSVQFAERAIIVVDNRMIGQGLHAIYVWRDLLKVRHWHRANGVMRSFSQVEKNEEVEKVHAAKNQNNPSDFFT